MAALFRMLELPERLSLCDFWKESLFGAREDSCVMYPERFKPRDVKRYTGFIGDVKRSADFVAIVSRYTSLRRSGRQLKGLCPFHSESPCPRKECQRLQPSLQVPQVYEVAS